VITDSLLIYFLGQIVLLIINIIAYTKIPYISIIGIMGDLALAADTIIAFGNYYLIAVILILTNTIIPFLSIAKAVRGR